jgi:uncharacterized protein (TIRG00374 family)
VTGANSKFTWKILGWLPGVVISIVAIILVFHKTSWQDLVNAFGHVTVEVIFLAILLFLVSLFSRAFAWRSLLKNKVTFFQTFLTMNEGYLLNNILPFRLGEFGRAIIMGKISQLGTFHVLSTIIMERIFDISISAGLLLLGIAFAAKSSSLSFIAWIVLGIIIAFFMTLWIISKNRVQIQNWVDKKSESSRFFQRFVKKYSNNFLQGLEFMREPKFFFPAVLFMLGAWGIALLEYFVLLKSFIPVATIWWAALGLGALAFGVAIPSAPAYVGVFEGALVLALVPLVGEAQKDSILAYALVIHIMHFILNGIFGLIGFLVQGNSISGLLKDISQQKTVSAETLE